MSLNTQAPMASIREVIPRLSRRLSHMMAIKGVMEQDQPQTGNVQGGQAPPKKGHIIKKRRNRRRRPYPVMVLSWIFRARIEVNYNSLSCI